MIEILHCIFVQEVSYGFFLSVVVTMTIHNYNIAIHLKISSLT